ncbi:MAG: class I SAM-dependent methyltransferase [Acidimicrobiales bacterium]
MPPQLLRPAVARGRALLDQVGQASPTAARIIKRIGTELVRSAERVDAKSRYVGHYFGDGRDPSGDRHGSSGYATYDRVSSNADVSGYVLWRTFGGARKFLDIGCASGFVVEVLRELGVQAAGCDVSSFAISNATPGAVGHVRVADVLTGLPWPDAAFDVVSVLETLEHLPPDQVPQAIAELRRVCGGFLYATIPSFGPSGGPGPDGFFDNKVRSERLEHYRSLGPTFDGPVQHADLERDVDGEPVEGHLTIASFAWWTRQFAAAGMTRRPDIESRIYADIEPAGLTPWWNLYIFSVPGASEAIATAREPERDLVSLGLRHPLYGT